MSENIVLSDDQERAMKILKSGQNVFLTGEAGTGKSTLIDEFVRYLEDSGIEYIVCAPTGIAAINVGGSTLHRAFRVPVGYLSEEKCRKKKRKNNVIKNTKVIIIDEISMCRSDLFDYVAFSIDQNCRGGEWCGGKQIVVAGDFSQLPPVIGRSEKQFFKDRGGFAFEGMTWDRFNFRTVYLHRIIRQQDSDFIDALNRARLGDTSCAEYFNRLVRPYRDTAVTLCSRNADADRINADRLASMPGWEKHYMAEFSGEAKKTDFNGADDLVLKEDARVMAIANAPGHDGSYVNGSMGTVTRLQQDSVTVRWDSGTESRVEPYKWQKYEYEVTDVRIFEKGINPDTGTSEVQESRSKHVVAKPIGAIRQIPLRLGYAITIHKSQGNTFPEVNVDLSGVFQEGQAYVALSRCSSPEGLSIRRSVMPSVFRADSEIGEFYEKCEEKELAFKKQEAEAEARRKSLTETSALLVDEKTAEKIRKNAYDRKMTVSEYLQNVIDSQN